MKTHEVFQKLKEGVEKVFNSQEYRKFLDFCSSFRGYSFHNTILIYMQKPNATLVAGIKAWNKIGRYVNKGEKGIVILAPKIEKTKEIVNLDGEIEEIEKEIIKGFRPVYVYDISQTNGKEIPILDNRLKTQTVEGETLFKILQEISKYPIVYEDLPKYHNGYFDFKKIVLSKRLNGDQKTKTLLHEYVHSVVENEGKFNKEKRKKAEILAESITYIVANYFGLDTKDYSFSYVATWSKDIKELLKYGKDIINYSNQIIETIEKHKAQQKREKVS